MNQSGEVRSFEVDDQPSPWAADATTDESNAGSFGPQELFNAQSHRWLVQFANKSHASTTCLPKLSHLITFAQMNLYTQRLELRLQTPSEALKWVDSLSPDVKREISAEWLARLRNATAADPWTCTFTIIEKLSRLSVGSCGFKGPPLESGSVEIAYGIDDPYRCNGYATESARSLVEFARNVEGVASIRAHTKNENPASERVLTKAGFSLVGEFDDPEDGLVNRWQIDFRRNVR